MSFLHSSIHLPVLVYYLKRFIIIKLEFNLFEQFYTMHTRNTAQPSMRGQLSNIKNQSHPQGNIVFINLTASFPVSFLWPLDKTFALDIANPLTDVSFSSPTVLELLYNMNNYLKFEGFSPIPLERQIDKKIFKESLLSNCNSCLRFQVNQSEQTQIYSIV